MTIRCWLLGHKIPRGYYGEGEAYLTIDSEGLDGVGTRHASLSTECARCGKRFKVGNLHLPKPKLTEQEYKEMMGT